MRGTLNALGLAWGPMPTWAPGFRESFNIPLFLTMTSENKEYDGLYLSNYATLNLADQLTRVPGVGAVNVMGAGDYSMRIWLDPAALRIRNLSAADVYQAIQSQNVEVSAGTVGQPLPENPAPGNTNVVDFLDLLCIFAQTFFVNTVFLFSHQAFAAEF